MAFFKHGTLELGLPETTALIGWTSARWQCAQNQRVTAQTESKQKNKRDS
jgi:hypothetical protein